MSHLDASALRTEPAQEAGHLLRRVALRLSDRRTGSQELLRAIDHSKACPQMHLLGTDSKRIPNPATQR